MADVGIRIEGIDELLARVTRLAELQHTRQAVKSVGIYVKGRIAQYPAERHAPQGFRSDAQRRGFFWKLRHGQIEVPYRRGFSPQSEALGRSWTVESRNLGLTAIIGNDTSYGPLVQDRNTQAAYHKATGWVTVQDVMEQEEELVIERVREGIEQDLAGV